MVKKRKMFYWNKNSDVPSGKTEKVKSVFLSEADGVQEKEKTTNQTLISPFQTCVYNAFNTKLKYNIK